MLRTPGRARPLRMTCMTAGVTGDRAKAFAAGGVANVVDERPGAIERRGAEKSGAPLDDVAGGIADAAADAFDARVACGPRGGIRPDDGERIASGAIATEAPLGARPLVEKLAHVGDEITNDRQMRERADFDAIAVDDLRDVRAAGPARHAVDRHRAGAAHADPACESIR